MAFEHECSNLRILCDEPFGNFQMIAQRLLGIELGKIFAYRAMKRRALQTCDDDARGIDARRTQMIRAERRAFERHDADSCVCPQRAHHQRHLQEARGQHRHANCVAQPVLQQDQKSTARRDEVDAAALEPLGRFEEGLGVTARIATAHGVVHADAASSLKLHPARPCCGVSDVAFDARKRRIEHEDAEAEVLRQRHSGMMISCQSACRRNIGDVPSRIEDYALVGDCRSGALIGRDGSVDWLCWPNFSSPACFAALVGDRDNGRWLIAPAANPSRVMRKYRENTLVLETTMETAEGAVTLVDFMPHQQGPSRLVRLVCGVRGTVAMRMELVMRFDYGRLVPWVTSIDDQTLRAICGPDMLVLRTPIALRGEGLRTVGEFTISEGQCVPIVLTYESSNLDCPSEIDALAALDETTAFWREWVRIFGEAGGGEWHEAVVRSLITLKALTYAPTGGIIAAPTTSLPEQLGGSRNWDYRFCWLRDATFTLLALMHCGYYEEAAAWRMWLLRAVAGHPAQVQIMYGLAGEHRLTEWEVPWLSGYEGASPVRIGNAAATQIQLDVYGEIMDALHQARVGKLAPEAEAWELQEKLLEHLEEIWMEPDEGIWEVRGGPQHFTYSKVMAWVAFDRAVKTVENFGRSGPVERWRSIRQRIHEETCARGFNAELGAFVQSYGSRQLDASLLLIPLVGFLDANDPRVRGTLEAVERNLMRDGLVLRYDPLASADGLPGDEGAFLACSFWFADNLVLLGRMADAARMFQRLLALRNDVGLLSEEYDPRAKRLVGNFPQAFSHITLINTALNLVRTRKPAEQRGQSAPTPGRRGAER
jgi:GH15 family glucan-1,4-alpha-glucosidase